MSDLTARNPFSHLEHTIMARNYRYEGDHIPFTAAAAVASGDGVVFGNSLCVALGDIANGDTGQVATEGVWTLPKLSTDVVSAGDVLTWDVSAGEFILAGAATGDLEGCAVATEAAGNGALTVSAKLVFGHATIAP